MLRKDKKLKYGDIVYYTDELNDDFAKTVLNRNELPADYKYVKKGFFYKLSDFFWYWCICKPILNAVLFFFGVKIKRNKKTRKALKNGAFVYANHTSYFDAFSCQCVVPGKNYIIGYTDALSLPGFVGRIIKHAGYMPLPTKVKDYKKFNEAMDYFIKDRHSGIVIFPEAHIWPFYNKIRNFKSVSFNYPAKYNVPVIPVVNCYRKSKFSKKAKISMFILDPIYPKEELSEKENRDYLRNECYKAMVECSNKYSTYEYVKYVKKEEKDE
jgi:1-acyl-sn-glycerol-3-phosphate acyltransferase